MSQNKIIRFGYCPPNPGPKRKLLNKWFSDIKDAIENWDGNSSIWIKTNGRYVEISFSKLRDLAENK